MKFTKEIRLTKIGATKDTLTIGVIRNPGYGSYLNWFIEAANIAKSDFPELTDNDIKIVQYGGSYYKGTFGIEFILNDMYEAPEGYKEIYQLELTK